MECARHPSCNSLTVERSDGGISYLCHMYTNSDLGSPQGADEFWVAHRDCPSEFSDFGIVGGCYRLYDHQMTWDDMEMVCNSSGPRVHLAGMYSLQI